MVKAFIRFLKKALLLLSVLGGLLSMALLNDINIGAIKDDDPKKQIEQVVQQVNEHARLISNEDKTTIKKDDSGTPRVLIGQGLNSFVGMKISQTGKDVTSAADSDLVFNSDNNVFKIVATGTFTWQPAVSSNTDTYQFAHNLGFVPVPLVFVEYTNTFIPLPTSLGATFGTADTTPAIIFQEYITCLVDDTNVEINYWSVLSNPRPSFNFRYYLLQETAN